MAQPTLSASLLERLPEGIPGGLLIYRYGGGEEILYANEWLIHLFGCASMDEFMDLTGGSFKTLVHPEDLTRVEEDIEEQIASGNGSFDFVNYRIRKLDGSLHRVEEFGHRVFVPDVGPVFYVFFINTQTKYMVYDIDQLTGLPGKTRFLQHADMTMAMASLDSQAPRLDFVYVNVRNFKFYNLRNGSEAGNRFLVDMADILRKSFPNQPVSRFADDHFVILSTKHPLERVLLSVARQIGALPDSGHLDIKFGVYRVNEKKISATAACDLAKMACDSIKDRPDRHVRFYTSVVSRDAELRAYVTTHFREALARGDLKVYFQPVIRTISGTLASVEALSRWEDPVHGFISPSVFIPALENSRLIKTLDLHVLEDVCRMLRTQKEKGCALIPVSFNLSRLDFFYGSIYEEVEAIRKSYGVPRNMLHIEVTESIFVNDGTLVRQEIDRFRAAGYEVWMDDFGSGYSSLNTLKDYYFDEIKIDLGFLTDFSKRSKDIIRATVRMAKDIGVQTLVEGVETKEQMKFVRSIGCEKIQGYYYGKPMPLEELRKQREEKKWMVETPAVRRYFASVGSVDFMTDKPMAIAEMNKDSFRYYFCNKAYLDVLFSIGLHSLEESENFMNSISEPIVENVRHFTKDAFAAGEERTITYTENGQYMKLDLLPLAQEGDRHLARAFLTNTTINEKESTILALDRISRNVFNLYQHMVLIDMDRDEATPLVSNTPYREYFYKKRRNIAAMLPEYAEKEICPEDRARFIQFARGDTIWKRLEGQPNGILNGYFRTLGDDGKYHLALHAMMPMKSEGRRVILYTVKRSPMDGEDLHLPLLQILENLSKKDN